MEANGNNLLLKYLKQTTKDPTTTTSPSSSSTVKVKQEKRDDPPSKPFPPPPPPPPQPTASTASAPDSEAKSLENSPPPIDFSSIMGRFGWLAVAKDHLPFIIRGEAKYFAVRMVESEVISKYTKILPYDAFTYTNIKSYYITENEAKLLNEINMFHCNGLYGIVPFTIKDVVVSIEDTQKFYEYLEFCKHKNELGTVRAKGDMRERCGLVQINKQFLMPYLTKSKSCYVLHSMLPPSVYCETSEELLDDWDLAYMKFVCWVVNIPLQKVQTSDKLCLLSCLKNYDSNSTVFQEVTVTKLLRSSFVGSPVPQSYHYHQSLKENYSRNVMNPSASLSMKMECKNGCGCMGPCSHLLDMRGNPIMSSSVLNGQLRAVPASGYWNSNGQVTSTLADAAHKISEPYKSLRLPTAIPASGYLKQSDNNVIHSKTSRSSARSELDLLFPPPPPPLVRVDAAHCNSTAHVPAGVSPCENGSLRPPPPLQPSSQYKSSSGNPVIVDVLSLVSKEPTAAAGLLPEEVQHSASSRSPGDSVRLNSNVPPYHYPTPPQSSPLQVSLTPTPADVSSSAPGEAANVLPGGAVIDLCSPPPSPDSRVRSTAENSLHQGVEAPHTLQSVQVDGKFLPCFNLEPFKQKSTLVLLISSLVKTFFPSVSVQSCRFALNNVLGVQLHTYAGAHQPSLANLGFPLNENDSLISVNDAKLYLPHLGYMFQHSASNDRILDSPTPKRLCTSSSSDN